MSQNYSRIFGIKLIFSTELQDKNIYTKLINDGFTWIKQKHNMHFDRIVRFPTVGRWLLLSRTADVGYVSITSSEGRRLINKLCYT